MHGRTSKSRDSTTIYFYAKATWPTLVRLLQDADFMADQGGTINISASGLKNLKRQGKLNLSARKIAKIELPNAVEQPNAHMLNRALRDLWRWCIKNAGACLQKCVMAACTGWHVAMYA